MSPLSAQPQPGSRQPRLAAGLRTVGCLLALGWQAACGGGPIEFDLNQGIAEQRIPGSGGGALTTLLQTPLVIGLDVNQQAKSRNANGPVANVAFTSMNFETTLNGSAADSMTPFDFVQSVKIYVESTRANSSLARAQIATVLAPPGRITGFNLTPDPNVNLLPYLGEGARLISVATGTLPTKDVTFAGSFTLHVRTL